MLTALQIGQSGGLSIGQSNIPLCALPSSTMTSSSNVDATASKSVTRLLQHSILQLCNEHITYSHTLQVLGVICLTVDDKQQEIVVKVNNTLKRVNPVTPPKETRPSSPESINLSYQTPQSDVGGNFCSDLTTETSALVNSVGGNHAQMNNVTQRVNHNDNDIIMSCDNLAERSDEGFEQNLCEEQETEGKIRNDSITEDLSNSRRHHGRKQTKPVRVKNVSCGEGRDCAEGNVDLNESENDDISTALLIDMDPQVDENHQNDNGNNNDTGIIVDVSLSFDGSISVPNSPAVARLKPNMDDISGVKRRLDDSLASTSGTMPSAKTLSAIASKIKSSSAVGKKSELYSITGSGDVSAVGIKIEMDEEDLSLSFCDFSDQEGRAGARSHLRPPPLVMAPNISLAQNGENLSLKPENNQDSPQEVALNFSLGALNGLAAQPPPLKKNGSTCVDEKHQNLGFIPSSSSIPVALTSSASSVYPNYDFLLGNLNNSLSLNTSLMNCSFSADSLALINAISAANTFNYTASNSQPKTKQKSSGKTLTELLDKKTNSSAKRLAAAVAKRHRERMRMSGTSQPLPILPAVGKVKDIIMYDDSAPLHAQRGAKVEGDFLLDALNKDCVNGKKRRRRTTEESLTAEEIAEYIGIADAVTGPALIRCRMCPFMSTDVTNYFSHSLSQHGSYMCHQCERSFTTKSSLLRHRPIHTGMRRFTCGICRKAFYRKDKCKAHIKRHLGLINESTTGADADGDNRPQSLVKRIEPKASSAASSGGTISVGISSGVCIQPAHSGLI